MMRIVYSFLLVFLSFFNSSVFGQALDFQFFKNIGLGTKASTVHCFAQDSLGILWLGSNNGLYSYDGYSLHAPTDAAVQYQTFIYSISVLNATHLAIGTGKGVLLYNYREDRYEAFPVGGPSDVRSLMLVGNKLWIGSISGLYCYDTKTKKLINYGKTLHKELDGQAIYALSAQADKILVGTYKGLYQLDPAQKMIKKLVLPDYRFGSNQFVNSIFTLSSTKNTFVGTEYGLYMYDHKSEKLSKAPVLQSHPIKSMATNDDRTLLIGTDDGLFAYQPEQQVITRTKHDSRNQYSLANNIIWSIYRDRANNIWLGTDLGISLWSSKQIEKRIPIYQFTKSSDGNRFYKVYQDQTGWYWLGGDNGLIRTKGLGRKDFESYWYRMDAPQYRLPHNRIRDIYQDRTGHLWIASDGGVNVFNAQTRQFRSFDIVDSKGTRNAKWAYNILEDKEGNLWIATYMGGIFRVNKEQLLSSSGSFVAGKNYLQSNGLLADFANQIVDNGQGKILALFYNLGISSIDPKTGKVEELKDKDGKSLSQATFMLRDSGGTIWIGQHGQLRRMDRSGRTDVMVFDPVVKGEVTAMVEVNDYIWLSTSIGVWRVHKKDLKPELLRYGHDVTAMYYDQAQDEVILGGINEVTALPAQFSHVASTADKKIVLTAMYVNNEPFGNYNYSLRYRNEITLDYDQNNLRLEFSDLHYGNHLGHRLAYNFKDKNENWIPLERGDNKVLLSNLRSGDYHLQVTKVDLSGNVVADIYVYNIRVKYIWYASIWAKIIYVLAGLGLLIWVMNFFRVRNTLKWERRERYKVLELTRMKMDFLTAISHELKTPLSLILAPVSQLMRKTKNIENKKSLEGVHRNALKINNLIQEVMAFDKDESQNLSSTNLLTSQIDLVAYAKQITEEWQNNVTYAHLEFYFDSDIDSVFVHTDVSKLGSIINNLLSNACKYSRQEKGVIKVEIKKQDAALLLSVVDTGIGILSEDLPYVFSKFYRSSSEEINKLEGTGVGLYLVKSYCDQLGWEINLVSTYQVGTAVSLKIFMDGWDLHEDGEDRVPSDKRKLLIVEDNEELSSFLKLALESTYTCRIAKDGQEGLHLISTNAFLPDIIISDAMMPIMGGLEMVRKLRQNTVTSTIPIILLTAKNDELIQREWVAVGVDAYMAKPFDLEVLKMQLLQLLAKKDNLTAQLRLQGISQPSVANDQISPDEKLLSKVTEIIENNIDDSDFSVQRLAEETGTAAKQLYRKIKQMTGYTPVEYIRSIRIKKAALMLQQKKFTVAEVMYMVGYSNASYFSKCFQAEFGMTPKAYMEKIS
ncbi:two-component regulator propeller domain-containing protein [Sphingobacterium sp. MYb388]|uniref:two-component regulator propeller domain-containing protein n=1 Tax=Sphingobacterium sp. MYb388 TaxID=2745437 RepID=UPI0030A81E69